MIKTGPHKKDDKFFLKRTDSFYNQIVQGRNLRMYNRAMMIENIQYALGEQDRWRYKKRPDEITQNDRNTLPTSDWRNSKLLYKIIKTVVSLIAKQELVPQVNCIDAFSKEKKRNLEAQLKLAQILKRIGADYQEVAAQIGIDPSEVPITNEGLRTRLSMQPQLREEMDMELAISKLLNIYEYRATELEQIKCNLITNLAGVVIDLDSCMPNIRAFNPLNGISDHSNKEDCSDINEAAEIILVPLYKLEAYAKNQFKDWNNVKAQARTYDQIVSMPGWSGFVFSAGWTDDPAVLYVPVLHATWSETRNITYKKLADGRSFLDLDVDPSKDRRDILEHNTKAYSFVFSCKRILNTDEMYDAGLLEPQIRFMPVSNPLDKTQVDPRTSHINFILSNPNVIFGRSVALVEEIKPEMDALVRATDKFNATLQAFIPQSVEIDMDALAELELGGEKRASDQLLAMYERKGILLVQKKLMRNGPNESSRAISILPNNMSESFERLQNAVDRLENKINMMSGIAATEMGQSAGNRVSQGLNQAMIDGQNNVLGCYFRARIQTYERLIFQLMLYVKNTGVNGIHDGQEFRIDKDEMRERLFNTSTAVAPSDLDWQILIDAATKAYQREPPLITFADYMIIVKGNKKNYKQFASYFAEKELQGKREQQEREERAIQMNNEGQAEAADRKAQGDIAKIQTKEKMIDQRTALVEQSKGMIKEAELDVTNKDALIAQLVKVNPRAANQYILEQLGVDPSLYAEDAAGLVDVIVNPPTKELGISN